MLKRVASLSLVLALVCTPLISCGSPSSQDQDASSTVQMTGVEFVITFGLGFLALRAFFDILFFGFDKMSVDWDRNEVTIVTTQPDQVEQKIKNRCKAHSECTENQISVRRHSA